MAEGGKKDRRQLRRFAVTCRAYAVNATQCGLITDISRKGMALRCIARKRPLSAFDRLDICVDECEFLLAGMPCSVVSEQAIADERRDPDLVYLRMGLRFRELTPEQEARLEYFLRNYTGTSPESIQNQKSV